MLFKISRFSTGEKVYLFCWNLYFVVSFFVKNDLVSRGVQFLLMGILLAKVFLIDKYQMKDVLKLLLIVMIGFFVQLSIVQISLLTRLLFIIGGRNISLKKLISVDIYLRIIILATIILLSFLGVLENYSAVINGTYKQSLGFDHPNTLGFFAIVILLEWLYLKYEDLRAKDYLLIITGLFVINSITGARTSVYVFFVILVLSIVLKRFPHIIQIKPIKYFLCWSPVFFTSVAIFLSFLYSSGNQLAGLLNTITTGRIGMMAKFLSQNPITLFGRPFEAQYVQQSLNQSIRLILDNGYIYSLYVYGVVLFVLFMVASFFLIKRTIASKDIRLFVCLMFFYASGLGEVYLLNPLYNFTLLLLLRSSTQAIRQTARRSPDRVLFGNYHL